MNILHYFKCRRKGQHTWTKSVNRPGYKTCARCGVHRRRERRRR